MPTGSGSLNRRATPAQTRSTITLSVILDASARLLLEQGLPGFNTNAVAKAAGINVATLYHYFPHKNAVLRELFERYEVEMTTHIRSRLDDLTSTNDLAGWIHAMVSTLLQFRREQPAGVALRRACRAVPELAQAEDDINIAAAADLALALRRRAAHLSSARAMAAARVMVEVTGALLDFAADRPDVSPAIAIELESLLLGYFAELGRPD